MKTTFWLMVVAAVVLVVPTAAQADPNVVSNPGFEIAVCRNTPNGTEPPVCGWISPTEIVRDTSNARSGQSSMKVTCLGHCRGGTIIASTKTCVPISPGTHAASFWYRAEPNEFPIGVGFRADFHGSPTCDDLPDSDVFSESAIDDGAWHQVSGHFSAGTNGFVIFRVAGIVTCPQCVFSVGYDDLYVDAAGTAPMPANPIRPLAAQPGEAVARSSGLAPPRGRGASHFRR